MLCLMWGGKVITMFPIFHYFFPNENSLTISFSILMRQKLKQHPVWFKKKYVTKQREEHQQHHLLWL